MAKNEAKPPRLSSAASQGTIIIRVGLQEQDYVLHKAFLSHYSGYFQGALSGRFSETLDGVVVLKEINPEVFSFFADWIYTPQIPDTPAGWGSMTRSGTEHDGKILRYRAYFLADRLIVPKLKSAIFNQLYDRFADQSSPLALGVIEAFESLPEQDPLLKLLVDALCWSNANNERGDDPVWYDKLKQLPPQFLAKVTIKLFRLWDVESTGRLKRSDYEIEES
ncbi:hypothetical protein BDV96DRAFT_643896 [Lophiotrema nucula]|uniref:BTB domain-containing protein n=1 Tax=Lophiotrema nucula TaxID=690887 RepID=A0A6A5ZF09_9PLEO|nr:hypothetical protein BDV96DRAFT_643896 [Lophiotrema nucula]